MWIRRGAYRGVAQEELVGWVAMVAVKVLEPHFNDLESARRLLQCCLGISIGEYRRGDLEALFKKVKGKMEGGPNLD